MRYILVPMMLLTIYSGSFAILSIRYLEKGTNYLLTMLLLILLLFLLSAVMIVYFPFYLLFKSKIGNDSTISSSEDKIANNNLLLLLLPLTPVVQYLLNNQKILSSIDSIKVFTFFVFFSFLYIFVFPLLFSRVSSKQILMTLGLAFTFTITSMASLSENYNLVEKESYYIPLAFFSGVFFITGFLHNLNLKKAFHIIIIINLLIAIITPVLFEGVNLKKDEQPILNTENELRSKIFHQIPVTTPNIYFLVYESYVPNETMLAYGIDNSSQEAFLRGKGFELYPTTYSVGSPTLESMSRVFNASTEFYGNPRRGVSGDGIVQNILKSLGYVTYGIFPHDYMFQSVGSSYDYSIPENIKYEEMSSFELMIKAILLGEFRFNLLFNSLSHDQFVEVKHNVLENINNDPAFIYTHSDLPGHAQGPGRCRPNEIELYQEDLISANLEMKRDVTKIINNDPDAIIIVAGDHGPYLTKSCYRMPKEYDLTEISRIDIQDRFATFLAIRWPGGDHEEYHEIIILQDLFPTIFAYIYNDPTILEARIQPNIITTGKICDATVIDGIIFGGIDDGEPLFRSK